jgi:hypothetical protein
MSGGLGPIAGDIGWTTTQRSPFAAGWIVTNPPATPRSGIVTCVTPPVAQASLRETPTSEASHVGAAEAGGRPAARP